MKKKRWLAAVLAAALLLTSACSKTETPEESAADDPVEQSQAETITQTAPADWDDATATKITLTDGGSTVDGSGATVNGDVVTITSPGTYVLSGRLSAGQVYVEATKDDTVQLVLNGVDITAAESAAIYAAKTDALIVTLAPGTANTLTDATDFIYADEEAEEPDAALFAKDDLTINGTGSLTVNASFHNGIGTKDDLIIDGAAVTVTAANHGIRGRDSVAILDGVLNITAGNDGIQSNNDSEGNGWILLEGGTYHITVGHDAVQAEHELTVNGGSFTLLTGGGHQSTVTDADGSYKGLKAGGDLTITGGTFDIDTLDDAVHSNADVLISGGTFQIATGDDGVHADDALTITGGEIIITASYEGLEGSTVSIQGGFIDLVASDDGINAAGGTDGGEGGMFGRDRFSSVSEDYWIDISGGEIHVNAQGDGIDSNGNITMSGGALYVDGPTSGGDGAIDYEITFDLTGGTLVASGSAGMAMTPSSTSSQPSLYLRFTDTQEENTEITLQDSAGNTLVQFTPSKRFQTIVLSAPGMEVGETYTILRNGSQLIDAALSDTITGITDTGEATGTGFGGFGGGGMGGGGQRPGGGGGGTPPDGMTGGGPGGNMGGRPSGGPGGGPGINQ